MSTLAIIQASLRNSLMPGKVLLPLAGASMLARVIKRVAQAGRVDRVLVAASRAPEDQAVVAEAKAQGVECFQGSINDVLDRFHQAARWAGASRVVRVTADCPLIDPGLIDQVVRLMDQQQADYASNFLERSYPRGLECEAMTMPALKTAWQMATEPNHRQQVSPYLQQRPDRFRLASLRCNRDLSHMWWKVDTAEDLAFVREVHRLMGDELTAAGWEQVLAQLEAHPELTKINSQVRRNESTE